jgi:hypothetical protein
MKSFLLLWPPCLLGNALPIDGANFSRKHGHPKCMPTLAKMQEVIFIKAYGNASIDIRIKN